MKDDEKPPHRHSALDVPASGAAAGAGEEGVTRGQIAQLQDLGKCYLQYVDNWFVITVKEWDDDERLDKWQKAYLRRLTHLYRHQIAAIRKNQA